MVLNPNEEVTFKLPERTRLEMVAMEKSIQSTRKMIQTLKGVGVDTADIEAKLDWAEETRKTLLKEFG